MPESFHKLSSLFGHSTSKANLLTIPPFPGTSYKFSPRWSQGAMTLPAVEKYQ